MTLLKAQGVETEAELAFAGLTELLRPAIGELARPPRRPGRRAPQRARAQRRAREPAGGPRRAADLAGPARGVRAGARVHRRRAVGRRVLDGSARVRGPAPRRRAGRGGRDRPWRRAHRAPGRRGRRSSCSPASRTPTPAHCSRTVPGSAGPPPIACSRWLRATRSRCSSCRSWSARCPWPKAWNRCRSGRGSARRSGTGSTGCRPRPGSRSVWSRPTAWRAWPRPSTRSRSLGLEFDALQAAEDEGLVSIERGRVVLRHPLLRSVAYHALSPHEQREVHAALATALERPSDVERRAWHRAGRRARSGRSRRARARRRRAQCRAARCARDDRARVRAAPRA